MRVFWSQTVLIINAILLININYFSKHEKYILCLYNWNIVVVLYNRNTRCLSRCLLGHTEQGDPKTKGIHCWIKQKMNLTSFSLRYQQLMKNILLINITCCKQQRAGLLYVKSRGWGEESQSLAQTLVGLEIMFTGNLKKIFIINRSNLPVVMAMRGAEL